jgi:hypothetical protein
MKIADNQDESAPVDQFKEKHFKPSAKRFDVSEKVPNVNHWKLTDKLGDPAIQKGW